MSGDSSSVYFACRQLLQWVVDDNPEAAYVFECTVFKHKHPRDWHFVAHSHNEIAELRCLKVKLKGWG